MSNESDRLESSESILLAAEIVAAFVGNNAVKAETLPSLIRDVYATVSELVSDDPLLNGNRDPAVPIEKSVTPDYVICLEDGKKLKMLKRYLRTHYDMTPDDYRRKWGLPADYPMVAPNYAKKRSKFAKQIGLGTTSTAPRKTRKKTTKKR